MTFELALTAMREGKKVRRPGWQKVTYLLMRDGRIYDWNGDTQKEYFFGTFKQMLITADDWEVVPTTLPRRADDNPEGETR